MASDMDIDDNTSQQVYADNEGEDEFVPADTSEVRSRGPVTWAMYTHILC